MPEYICILICIFILKKNNNTTQNNNAYQNIPNNAESTHKCQNLQKYLNKNIHNTKYIQKSKLYKTIRTVQKYTENTE